MITPEEFKSRWNNFLGFGTYKPEPLFVYAEEFVSPLNLSDVSKEFLVGAGLPGRTRSVYHFNLPPNQLPPLPEAPLSYKFPEAYRHLRLLGKIENDMLYRVYFRSAICLDESSAGRVVEVHAPNYASMTSASDLPLCVTVLNSSVVHFAAMLLLLEEHTSGCLQICSANYDQNVFQKHCERTANCLRHVDPQAFAHENGWSDIIDDLESAMD